MSLVAVGVGGMAGGLALGGSTAMAPAPVVIDPPTAEVRSVEMRDTTALRCSVTRDSATLAAPAAVEGSSAVVTKRGDKATLASGAVIAEISGRPVLLLHGPYPLYRTLKVGDEGRDVKMLQESLAEFTDLSIDGTFDESTVKALTFFYKDRGYTAPTITATPSDVATGAAEATPAASGVSSPEAEAVVIASPSELLMVASGSIELASPLPQLGAKVPDPLVTYYTSAPYALCTTDRQADVQAKASVTFADNGVTGVVRGPQAASVTGGAASTGSTSGTGDPAAPGSGAAPTQLRVDFTKTDGAPATGTELNAEVTIATSKGTVLAVPVSALHTGTSGSAVTVWDHGARREVDVTTGMLVDGLAEVTPVTPDALHEGDTVLVGT